MKKKDTLVECYPFVGTPKLTICNLSSDKEPNLGLPEDQETLDSTQEDKCLNKIQPIGEHKFSSDIIVETASELIEYHEQLRIIELFGTIDYDETYDYKKQRQQR